MYNYSDSIKILITKFPLLKTIYKDNIEEFEGLPYVFYEGIFVQFILDKIHAFDEQELKNIFDFIEDMLQNGDDETKNLIGVAVIERLFFETASSIGKLSISNFFGALTKKCFENCI